MAQKTTAGADVNKLTLTRLDTIGRVLRQKQEVSGVHAGIVSTFSTQYTYNLAGLLTSTVYPHGKVVATGYDLGGQPTLVTSGGVMVAEVEQGPDPAAPAVTVAGYGPHGGLQRMRYGVGGPVEVMRYNSRLQMTSLQVADPLAARNANLTLNYGFGVGALNNGNLISQSIVTPTQSFTQNYEYDGIGRLLKFSEGSLIEENVYDRYGNRAVYLMAGQSNPSLAAKVNDKTAAKVEEAFPAKHQATGTNADDVGNITGVAGQTFEYDAENRMVKAKMSGNSGVVVQFGYDGDGRRVWKAVCAAGTQSCDAGTASAKVTVFAYDAGGALLGEYGALPAGAVTGRKYLVADHLGSTRMAFADGPGVPERSDYMPFGEEISRAAYGAVMERAKFTGQQRDEEIKLDYFVARYMSPGMGRFMRPDPLLSSGRLNAPQSWNRYAYVLNNPLSLVDPTGLVDKPASKKFEEAFKRLDPTMYEVVVASNNYSQQQFEADIANGAGVNNTTFGLAGESVVIDQYRKTLPRVGSQARGVQAETEPENGKVPDIGALAPSVRTDKWSITTVAFTVATADGGSRPFAIKAPNSFVFSEVKTGRLNPDRVANAMIQIDSAPVVLATRAISQPFVVVDANQWNYRISAPSKAALVGFGNAIGVRIQLFEGLNTKALYRVDNLVNALRK